MLCRPLLSSFDANDGAMGFATRNFLERDRPQSVSRHVSRRMQRLP
jgi:hypothetical protein